MQSGEHLAPVLRATNQAVSLPEAFSGWTEMVATDIPEGPRIISKRDGLPGSDRRGFTSAQLPVESLSSLGSNAASWILIPSVNLGGFAKEVPAPYFSTGESNGRGRSAAHSPGIRSVCEKV